MTNAATLHHLDTCLSDCWQGYPHGRSVVLCIPVDGDSTHREVREQCEADLHAQDGTLRDGTEATDLEWAAIERAIWAAFHGLNPDGALDDSLEPREDDCDHYVYAYFAIDLD